MKELKASNKNGQKVIEMYNRMHYTKLEELYNTYSFRKEQAYRDCVYWCSEDDGYNFRVGSANTFGFSAGWIFYDKGLKYLRIETPKNSYLVNMCQ